MRHYLFLFSSLLLAGFALVGCSNPAAGSSGSPPATTVPPTVVTPTVLSTSPLDTATAVVLNTRVSANFSEAMDSTTVTVTNFSLKQGSTPVVGSVAYSGTTATFTPTSSLSANLVYTAAISTGVKSQGGVAMAAAKIWSFTTGAAPDLTPPTVISTVPADLATGVDYSASISAHFSKTMDSSTITTASFTIKQGLTAIPGVVSTSGSTATFNPTANLSANTLYTVTVTTAVQDLVGNAMAANKTWSFTTGSARALVNLGSSINYVVLAESAISTVPSSAIIGDIGISPAAESYITGFSQTNATGFATSPQVTGKIFAADMAPPTPGNLTTAVGDMVLAYTDAAGRQLPDYTGFSGGNIGGKTLAPGLYKWTGSVTAPTAVTISGSATDVWIFQIAGNLSVSPSVAFSLTGGAQAKNIFWQVAGSVNLAHDTIFQGVILSKTSINLESNVTMTGRLLGQTAVSLSQDTLTNP